MNLLIKVLIVDDQRMFREGVRARLEHEPDIQVVGEACCVAEMMSQIKQTRPTILTLDIRMPDASGIEAAKMVRRDWPDLKILMLTGYDYDQYVRASIRVGVDGFLLKDAPQEELVAALREIAAGGAFLPPNIASKVIKTYSKSPVDSRAGMLEELTMREIEVLEMMFQGFRNADIARGLSISTRTADTHVGSIIGKLGAQTRTDAVRIALTENMIK